MQSGDAAVDADQYQDAELLRQQVATQAFGQILSSSWQSLYRRAYQLVGNAADAEDVVQEALLAAYMHLDQFRGQSKMSTWIGAIVNNCARMKLRTSRRHPSISLDEPGAESDKPFPSWELTDRRPNQEDEYQKVELDSRLSHFYNQLTPRLRSVFQLHRIDGLSICETAQILGIPRGTVKTQSARARKKLSQLMRRTITVETRN